METFKKRQKAWARKEKQQKKAARKLERREEKAKSGAKTGDDNSAPAQSIVPPASTIL
ncbi:MAG TPA: hypothetical protein VH985_24635 [Candidatus Binatia bacterium]|jgi:hypothetical protein